MCDVLSLLNDVVADIATIKPDCSEPELNDDPYKLLNSSELAWKMGELCGVDIIEESRKLMRAMTAKAASTSEVREYRGWCSVGDMLSMHDQLWNMLPKYNNMQTSKYNLASVLYAEIRQWHPDGMSSVRSVIAEYYIWLNKQANMRRPDVPYPKRRSCIKDAVTFIFIKALEFTVEEYRAELERENDDHVDMLANGDIPF